MLLFGLVVGRKGLRLEEEMVEIGNDSMSCIRESGARASERRGPPSWLVMNLGGPVTSVR